MGFYDEMQDVASGLLGEFNQGTIVLLRPNVEAMDPDRPWDVTVGSPTRYLLNGVARTVERKWIDGTTIVGDEVQVTFAVPDVEPVASDQIEIDGRVHRTVDMRRLPEAGTPVAYIFFVRS